MTNESDDEQHTQGTPDSNDVSQRVVFTLQGAMAASDHSHFHHHHFQPCPENSDQPLNFKDARANEQADKLRDKLRERQLGGAAANVEGESVIVPCTGHCGPVLPCREAEPVESPEDAADEILQQRLSDIAPPTVREVDSTSLIVEWPGLDINCIYNILLSLGKKKPSPVLNVTSPYRITSLSPGTQYNIAVEASVASITGTKSADCMVTTVSTAPDTPLAPRPGGAAKTNVLIKWNAPFSNGSPITNYVIYWDNGLGSDNREELMRTPDKQYRVPGLVPGKSYSFRISAVNMMGESDLSDVGTCTTSAGVPAPPNCIYLGQATETKLTVCWSCPTDNGGGDVTGYSVEIDSEYGFISVYNGEMLECTVPDLARSTSYKFRVYSHNIAGRSRASAVVTFSTRAGLPPKPCKVAVSGKPHSDSAVICWETPELEGDQEILRYNLQITAAEEGVTPSLLELHTIDQLRCTIPALQPGCAYRVLVTIVTAGGEGPPSPPLVFRTRPIPPSAPQPPTLKNKAGCYSLHLKWGCPSYTGGAPITKYTLEKHRSTEDWELSYTGLDCDYLVPELQPGKCYTFRLRAHNVTGASLFSNTVNYTTSPAPPAAPPPPTVLSKGPYSASLMWEPSATHGTPVTQYTIEMCPVDGKFVPMFTGNCNSCVVKELEAGCKYYCVIKAHSIVGPSAPSEVTEYNSPPAPPTPISKIQLDTVTDSSFAINYKPPPSLGSEILYYNVCFNATITKTEDTYFTVSELVPETVYKVRVQAVNTVGAGPFSPVFSVTTKTPPPPQIAGAIQLLVTGHNFLKVSWSSVKGMKLYLVEKRALHESEYVPVYTGPKTVFKIGKLSPCTEYNVRVCAVNSAGSGEFLEGVFSTAGIPPPSIIKLSSMQNTEELTVSWGTKDKLGEREVYQTWCHSGDEKFKQVYEGTAQSYTMVGVQDTLYSFKIRVKRESAEGEEYGPYSQTIVLRLKPIVKETPSNDTSHTDETEELVEQYRLNEQQITIVILMALCLPAVLAVYFFCA